MESEKNYLYEIPISVKRGQSCPMPSNLVGAYVCCYVGAQDHFDATRKAVLKLVGEGYIFKDIVNRKVNEIDPSKWEEYIDNTWSEFKDHFPTQDEIASKVEEGEIFYGPFIGYETN